MNENISKSHQSNIVLAPRWKRLIASLFDSFIMLAVTSVFMYFTSNIEDGRRLVPSSYLYQIFFAVIGIITYTTVNASLLIKSGQTVGKKIMKIFIVDQYSENVPTKSNLIIRSFIFLIFPYLFFIGILLSIIDVVAIFGKERRCMHDYFSKTKVVENKIEDRLEKINDEVVIKNKEVKETKSYVTQFKIIGALLSLCYLGLYLSILIISIIFEDNSLGSALILFIGACPWSLIFADLLHIKGNTLVILIFSAVLNSICLFFIFYLLGLILQILKIFAAFLFTYCRKKK